MTAHISKTVSNCYASLRQIRSICRSLPKWVMSSLVAALVLTRLDGGNAMLVGLPARQLNRLQHVLHAAARLVYGARKFDHVTPLLRELHWLSVPERITFKLATLMFDRVSLPSWHCMRQLISPSPFIEQLTMNLGADCAPALHPHYWFRRLAAVLLVTALFRSQARACGTVCQPLWHHSHHC